MRFRRSLVLIAAIAIVAAATGSLAFAQTTGDITGTVTDTSGAALPGVTCTATSASLQGSRVAVTNNSGSYRLSTLPPGTYKVSCGLAGFATTERTALVGLGSTATVNQSLQISQREEIVVSGQAPVVDTTNTTQGSNYSAKVMEKLPLGRNYANVVKMQPGVGEDTGDQQGRGLALSIYGSTSAENVFVIDGVNTNSVVRGVQGKVINNEFIQEVEVKTGGYQAEYGRSTGGIINVITKSGGNEFHGDVFGNMSPTSFRSEQRHDDGDKFNTTYDDVKELDYGADLGGFIIKDRLWFFTAYDRVDNERDRVPKDSPSVNDQHFQELDNYNLFSGKLTWNIVQGSTIVGTYFRDPEVRAGAVFTPTGTDPNGFSGRQDIGSEDYAGRFNQLFGSFGVLTLQYSKHNDKFRFKPLDPTRAGIQDRTVAADYPNHPIFVGFGAVAGYRFNNQGERDEYTGNFTAYFGNNELKFGGDYVEAVTTDNSFYTGQQRIRAYPCSTNPASSSFCPEGEGVSFMSQPGMMGIAGPKHRLRAVRVAAVLGGVAVVGGCSGGSLPSLCGSLPDGSRAPAVVRRTRRPRPRRSAARCWTRTVPGWTSAPAPARWRSPPSRRRPPRTTCAISSPSSSSRASVSSTAPAPYACASVSRAVPWSARPARRRRSPRRSAMRWCRKACSRGPS